MDFHEASRRARHVQIVWSDLYVLVNLVGLVGTRTAEEDAAFEAAAEVLGVVR